VRAMADRVMVMYQGRVVETGDADAVLNTPRHAYTQRLLAATPVPDPGRQFKTA
jgi:ABC-type dipeptide/oligopeptide/nickel transport system ATPase component